MLFLICGGSLEKFEIPASENSDHFIYLFFFFLFTRKPFWYEYINNSAGSVPSSFLCVWKTRGDKLNVVAAFVK